MAIGDWMYANLGVQGFCLSRVEADELRLGLRFSTGLCLPLVATAIVLESVPMLIALTAVAVVAGFASRHPFDMIWNYAARHLTGAPPLPRTPSRRRHAFKIGAAWLATVGVLFAVGQDAFALGLGIALLGACGVVTAANFCVPSTIIALLERRFGARAAERAAAT